METKITVLDMRGQEHRLPASFKHVPQQGDFISFKGKVLGRVEDAMYFIQDNGDAHISIFCWPEGEVVSEVKTEGESLVRLIEMKTEARRAKAHPRIIKNIDQRISNLGKSIMHKGKAQADYRALNFTEPPIVSVAKDQEE